jgi:hypothetical protein
LGGVFNALVAPLVFKSVIEYPLAIVLACLLLPKLVRKSRSACANDGSTSLFPC